MQGPFYKTNTALVALALMAIVFGFLSGFHINKAINHSAWLWLPAIAEAAISTLLWSVLFSIVRYLNDD